MTAARSPKPSSAHHPLHADRCAIVDATRALVLSMPDWAWADVTNPDWCARVHPLCFAIAERWVPIRGPLLLLGKSESGKTSCLRALLWRLRLEALTRGDVGHPVVNAVWANAVDYAKHRRELRRGTPDFDLERMRTASILVLDEVGQEDAAPQWLLEVVDVRYVRRRPTLTTSGLTRDQLESRYGSGITRRLEQPGGKIVDLYEGSGG